MENKSFIGRFIEACGTNEPSDIKRKLEISYQAAKNYLEGRLPSAEVLIAFTEKTGYSAHWLLTGEGPKSFRDMDLIDFLYSGQVKEYVLRRESETDEGFKRLLETLTLESAAYRNIQSEAATKLPAVHDLSKNTEEFQTVVRQLVKQEVEVSLAPIKEIIQRIGRMRRKASEEPVSDFDDSLLFVPDLNPNDFMLPEGVGVLFKDWDKLSDEDKAATLKQIKEIVEDKKTPRIRNNKKKK